MGKHRGFSLVELLVVLFVIVLLTGLVSLNVNSGAGDRVLRDQIDSLRSIATYALDEAQFSGTDYGVLFVESINSYGDRVVSAHWRQRLPQGWRLPEGSPDLFEPIEFDASAELQLFLDGAEAPPVIIDVQNPLNGATPQWLLLSSGETQSGELYFTDTDNGDALWRIEWDVLARFEQFRGESGEPFGNYAQSL